MITPDSIIGDSIDKLVETLFGLNHQVTPKQCPGIIVSTELTVSFSGYVGHGDDIEEVSESGLCTSQIHFLYYGRVACWSMLAGRYNGLTTTKWSELPVDMWQFQGSHDSCWRGRARDVLSQEWLKMREDVLSALTPEQKKLALYNISDNSEIGGVWNRQAVTPVLIDFEVLRGDDMIRGYHAYRPKAIEALSPLFQYPV